jgi:hypothetical protein
MIFCHNSADPICLSIRPLLRSERRACLFLQEKDGLYRCYVFGFRRRRNKFDRFCAGSGFYNFYNFAMLVRAKKKRIHFCVYRTFYAPIIAAAYLAYQAAKSDVIKKVALLGGNLIK